MQANKRYQADLTFKRRLISNAQDCLALPEIVQPVALQTVNFLQYKHKKSSRYSGGMFTSNRHAKPYDFLGIHFDTVL